MNDKKKVIINGGGICGLTTAIALQNSGFEIEIYEAAKEFKAIGAGLVLSANAIKALKAIGIISPIIKAGNNLSKFYIKNEKGAILSEAQSILIEISDELSIHTLTIHRAELHQILLEQLNSNVKLFANKKAIRFNNKDEKVIVEFEDKTSTSGDYLLACDGIHSNIRKQLIPSSKIRYAGYTCWRGVLNHQFEGFDTTIATETWGKEGRFGIVPLSNNRIYWFACINSKKANNEYFKNFTIQQLQNNFQHYHFPIAESLTITAQENIHWDDISDLKPLKQFAFGNILLMGDAGHATTPNMGQGACQAIEDAAVLRLLSLKHNSLDVAFQQFEKERIKRTSQIVNTSWTFGKLAQITNRIGISIRNFIIKNTPKSATEKQIEFLYNIEFE